MCPNPSPDKSKIAPENSSTYFVSSISFLICLLVSTLCCAQVNLVPNPGFEELRREPPVWNSDTAKEFDVYMKDWFTPSNGTADIYSTDVDPQFITALPHSTYQLNDGVPRGTQLPRTGKRVVGIKPLWDTRREYVSIKLSCALIPGKEYYAEMYVCLSEQTNYAQNNLGMYFSDTLIQVPSYNYLDYSPQIVESEILNDSSNWVKISGTFTATSPAEYLLIGCFSKESDINYTYLGDNGLIETSYYFIDDVSVSAVNPTPVITITGNTSVCAKDTLTLTASSTDPFTWYNAEGDSLSDDPVLKVSPTSSTYYEVFSENCLASARKRQHVTVHTPQALDLGNDTSVCSDFTLDASGFTDYVWTVIPSKTSTTALTPTFVADTSAEYFVQATDNNGCRVRDSISITRYPTPAVSPLGEDIVTCNPIGTLQITPQEGVSYLWNTGSRSPEFSFTNGGTYWVTLSSVCGISVTDSITITAINMNIQNLITPNEDNLNDALIVGGIELGKGEMNIFNRFGSEVFRDTNYNNNWKAEGTTDGVYYYEFRYPGCDVHKGWVQVIR